MLESEDIKNIFFVIILVIIMFFVGVMCNCLIGIEEAVTTAKDNCIAVNEEIYCKK